MAPSVGAAARTWPLRLASRLRFFMRRTGSAIAANAAAEAADTLSAALLPSPAGTSLACHALQSTVRHAHRKLQLEGSHLAQQSWFLWSVESTDWCNQSRS